MWRGQLEKNKTKTGDIADDFVVVEKVCRDLIYDRCLWIKNSSRQYRWLYIFFHRDLLLLAFSPTELIVMVTLLLDCFNSDTKMNRNKRKSPTVPGLSSLPIILIVHHLIFISTQSCSPHCNVFSWQPHSWAARKISAVCGVYTVEGWQRLPSSAS